MVGFACPKKHGGVGILHMNAIADNQRNRVRVDAKPLSEGALHPAEPLSSGDGILIVERHPEIRDVMARHFREKEFSFSFAQSGEEALALVSQTRFDLIL